MKVQLIDLSTFLTVAAKEAEINAQLVILLTDKARIVSVRVNEDWALATIFYGEL